MSGDMFKPVARGEHAIAIIHFLRIRILTILNIRFSMKMK